MVDLKIVPFKFKHFNDLKSLLICRRLDGHDKVVYRDLPKTGYIVYYGKQPIAVGFIARIEPNNGMLDSFASNPYYGSKIRHEALDLIVNTLIEDAKRLKLKRLIAFSQDEGIINRAKSIGFIEYTYAFMIKPL